MKTILLVIFFLNTYFISAQTFETNYTNCSEEILTFKFQNDFLYKTNNYYKTTERIPSRLEDTGFDRNGSFYEDWAPTYYLERYGINEFQKITPYIYRLVFDKKGGNLLCIMEIIFNKQDEEKGTLYFTKVGYNVYCKE